MLGYRFDQVARLSEPDENNGVLPPSAYCTDVSAVPPETWPHLRGLNTLVLDALRHRHHPTHLTVGQAVSVMRRAVRTWFVHMSHDLPHEETDAGLPRGMGLAWDGLEVGVSPA